MPRNAPMPRTRKRRLRGLAGAVLGLLFAISGLLSGPLRHNAVKEASAFVAPPPVLSVLLE